MLGILRDKTRAPRRAISLVGFTTGMLAAATAQQAPLPEERAFGAMQVWVRRWATGLLRISGVRPIVSGRPIADYAGPRLIVANHRSPMDVPVLLSQFGGVCLSRADVAHWPLIGLAASRAGTIFVDRADKRSGAMAIRAIRRSLSLGHTVIVFPEGGTFAGDQVRPLRAGALSAAKGLGVQIVPVGLAYPPGVEWSSGSFVDHVSGFAQTRRTQVGIAVGEPFIATQPTAVLAAELQANLQALTHQARHQIT